MTPGPHRHGRRDNGLHASEYAIAGDVDPRVGEHLLDVLGLAGIAAYLQPTADLHPVTRTTTLPSRPIDRLYVDRAHLTEAREYLDKLGPAAAPSAGADPPAATAAAADPTRAPHSELDPTAPQPPVREDGGEARAGTTLPGDGGSNEPADIDAAWAAIIADYDVPADHPVPPWPVAEDLTETGGQSTVTGTPARPAPDVAGEQNQSTAATSNEGRPPGDWRTDPDRPDLIDSLDGELDDDEGYEPPPPPPIPRPSRYAALATVAIALGMVLCIRPDLLGIFGFGEAGGLAVGFICLLTGFVTLVIRLRPGNDDDDPDDGAVV